MTMSGAERQAAYRARQAARVRELEEMAAASHNDAAAPDLEAWLNRAPILDIATTLVNEIARPERAEAIICAMTEVYRARRLPAPAIDRDVTCAEPGCNVTRPKTRGRRPKEWYCSTHARRSRNGSVH